MRLWYEEQFGPVVPISFYDDISEVVQYARDGKYAQQVSIFAATGTGSSGDDDDDGDTVTHFVDVFHNIFGKININQACGRSPDTLPFSGRRSSAMGTMSVIDSIHAFTTETVIATNSKVKENKDAFEAVISDSKFAS